MKRLLPSITYWNRLEPSPRSNDLLPALAGAVGDGLWCLTRQWQFGEFEAVNGGSAAWIEVATTTDRLSHRVESGNLVPLDPVAPLETLLAEHRTLDVATAVDLGQLFDEMLAAAGHGHHASQLRSLYPVAGATEDEIAEGDEELLRFRGVVAGRALDGGALYHAARISPANALAAATFDAATRAQITTLLQQFVADTREFLGDRFPNPPPAWQAERLEYEVDVVVRNTGSLFTSRPGPNGEVTWDTLAVEKPQLSPASFEARTREVLTLLPANVRVRGQQTSRWWDFDRSEIDFGALDVEPQEAAKLIVTDYLQQQGGEWYVVPVEQPVGTLMHIDHVLVRDVFGALISVPPARDAQGRPPMFTIGGLLWTSGHLLVPSAADIIQFGEALEEVRFVRDDMLNMVWAVEEAIEGALGRPVSGRDRARRRIAEEPPAGPTSFVYRTSTAAPEHWVPFVPVTRTNEVSFERIGDPAGTILRPTIVGDYHIAEEELRRSGLRIRRCAARCRDARGGTRLWIMRRTDVSATKETPAPRFDPLIPREVVEVTPQPEPPGRVGTTTTLIQSTFGLRGDFEVIVPAPNGGFAHYVRDNDDPALPWRGPVFFASDAGPIDALSLIQSRAGNLAIVARLGNRLALFRQDATSREWSAPEVFASGVAGSPSFIERHGGGLEVVAPLAGGGLVHFTRDPQTRAWSLPKRFAAEAGRVEDAALIESTSGSLELVGRISDRLANLRREAGSLAWSAATFFAAGVSGAPSFIQSRTGARNFEVVAPSAGGGLLHWSGNASSGSWSAPVPFGSGIFQSAALIQSNFNDSFEVIARQGEALIHFRSRPAPLDWQEAGRVGPTVMASYGANFLEAINVVLSNTSAVTAVNLRITNVTNITAAAPSVIALRPHSGFPWLLGDLLGGEAKAWVLQIEATAGSIEVPFSFTITYQADNLPPQTAVINVPFPRSMSFAGSPLTINSGASGKLTLNLTGNQAPAGGLTVNLSSSDPSRATVPATVSFAAGATSVSVPVAGLAPGSAVITANATVVNFPATATATMNITGAIGAPATTTVGLGRSAPFAVTLAAPASAGGVTVTLKSSDPSKVTVPASIVIPQGSTTPATQPQVTGVGIGSATITASATGYTPGSGTVTVSAPTMTFTGSPLVIAIGATGNLTLSLTGGQAPAGGLTVNLSSSDPGKATVPATVSFAAGATNATVIVTGVAPGTATITASAPNIANATTGVTITGAIGVPANTSVGLGRSVSFAVTLAAPAPAGGVTVTLKSSDTSKATVPASVVIPQGATTPATQPQVTGIGIGSATITASATGYTSATGTVTVSAPTMAFTGAPPAITIGGTGNLTLSLTGGQAPAGGLTVSVSSSDTSKATVPATASFAAGATSAIVPVTGVAPGTATITASAPNIANATIGVTITGAIGAPANTTVGLGRSAAFAVTLAAPAPAGGVTITLKSSDISKVTVPASVVIPQGATTPATQPQVTGAGIGSATITASATGYTPGSGTITVSAPTMTFTGSPLVIAIGATGNLTLSLTGGQAPAGGLTVNLSSSDTGKATVPATVSFAAGATSAIVPVTGVAPGTATITASAPNIANATIGVTITGAIGAPANTSVGLGRSAAFAVTLAAPAPAGGVTITLKSSDISKVTVPASVVIPQGATTPATQPQVTGAGIGSATITASATGYTPGIGTVTVSAPTMAFTGAPLAITIGGTGNLTLSLTGGQAPAGGLTVSVSSSDTGKATVPATVSFAAGATSATVPVTGVAAGTATVTASAPNIANATTGVTVTPPPNVTASYGANFLQVINVILINNTSGVTAVNLRITGVTNITAVAPNVIALLPSTIIPMPYGNVAGGQGVARNFTFGAAAGSVEVPFSFTIRYLADNMPPRTAVIDVPFPRAMGFSGSPLAINAGASGNLTLNLTGNQAPAGGLTVNLSSSDPNRATVPATVTFAAGATSVAVPVAGIAPGTAVITANATVVNFPATATATVNVTGGIGTPANTTVGLGRSASFAMTLPGPAPAGGVTVTLKSSDASKVTVPASVVIPQGATTPPTQPQVTGIGIGSATITAAATGYTSGTGTVTVSAPTMTFTGAPLAITIGGTGNLTLSLTGGQAPAGGLTVNLSSNDPGKATVPAIPAGGLTVTLSSSNPSRVTVPATVTFAAGATSVNVPVAGITPGSALITANATVVNFPATATATVNVLFIVNPPDA